MDPSKCTNLTIDEKRELVHELSNRPHGASEMLQSWSRQDILQILCAEMGKERKYTGLTKLKIIENLLKIVSEKKSEAHRTTKNGETSSSKRQRKTDNPSLVPLPMPPSDLVGHNSGHDSNNVYCKNFACKAGLRHGDAFCKRCSCCICHLYDENKDPSLWLVCSSEPPFVGESCGMSCHLECALKHEKAGIGKGKQLDGSYSCIYCGKVNDLLGCWRKQLMVAKDTRRVDILCYRASLGKKLLNGTTKYQKIYEILEEAVKKLEAEVGPLTGLPVKLARGIVNRLSSGAEVQKLCDLAVNLLDRMISETILLPVPSPIVKDMKLTDPNMMIFEDVSATSLTLVLGHEEPYPGNFYSYYLWLRKVYDMDYPVKPTCTLYPPNTRFLVTGLTPATDYCFKVVCFNGTREIGNCEVQFPTNMLERSQSAATNCSSLSNPSSVEDETNNVTPFTNQDDDKRAGNFIQYPKTGSTTLINNTNCPVSSEGKTRMDVGFLSHEERALDPQSDVIKSNRSQDRQIGDVANTDNGSHIPVQIGTGSPVSAGSMDASLPITPCKTETLKDPQDGSTSKKSSLTEILKDPQDGSTSKKSSKERDQVDLTNSDSDRDFEHCVKVIRWLETEGHIEKNFRQKFLTWYSLRASPQEVRIVKIFVDTFIEDLASLAEQLIDTFSETISNKRATTLPPGFCMKLWH
ncbi:hypothetical protein ACFE04_010142 [Oxalis oulophora]